MGGFAKCNRLSLLCPSLASVPLTELSREADPLQPKMPDAMKTRSTAPFFALQVSQHLATSEVAPVTMVPSVSPHSLAEPTPLSTIVCGFTMYRIASDHMHLIASDHMHRLL